MACCWDNWLLLCYFCAQGFLRRIAYVFVFFGSQLLVPYLAFGNKLNCHFANDTEPPDVEHLKEDGEDVANNENGRETKCSRPFDDHCWQYSEKQANNLNFIVTRFENQHSHKPKWVEPNKKWPWINCCKLQTQVADADIMMATGKKITKTMAEGSVDFLMMQLGLAKLGLDNTSQSKSQQIYCRMCIDNNVLYW